MTNPSQWVKDKNKPVDFS